MVKVSVIIPVYNGARFIANTLESVFHQTYSNYEIIVINDGSTDDTAEVLKPYLDDIYYVEQRNQGVAAARNRGLALAQGEFAAFLDQDDLLLPDKLALQIDCFNQHPAVGIVHSGWQVVDAEANKLSDVEPWREAPVLDAATWIKRMPVLFSAMLFRRDWLLQVEGLDSQFKQACDVDLIQRLVLAGCQSIWLPKITVLYRQHNHNDSLNTLIQAAEVAAVQERFFAQPNLPPEIRQVQRESRYYTLVWLAWRLYYTNRLPEMAAHLERAFQFRSTPWTETVIQWVELFKGYQAIYGSSLDVEALINSAEWQQLMQRLFSIQAASIP